VTYLRVCPTHNRTQLEHLAVINRSAQALRKGPFASRRFDQDKPCSPYAAPPPGTPRQTARQPRNPPPASPRGPTRSKCATPPSVPLPLWVLRVHHTWSEEARSHHGTSMRGSAPAMNAPAMRRQRAGRSCGLLPRRRPGGQHCTHLSPRLVPPRDAENQNRVWHEH